jgi:hypothetical protein
MAIMTFVADLPLRLTTPEVLALGRFSIATLHRRIGDGSFPRPADKRCRPHVFDRDAVLAALRIGHDANDTKADEWEFDPVAIREARARQVRDGAAPDRRNRAGPVRGPGKASAPRLVADNPAAPRRPMGC